MTDKHGDIRREYNFESLSKTDLHTDPLMQFGAWLDQALAAELVDATAMTLATADGTGRPSARIVLLKHHDDQGLVFYSDYGSQKAADLNANPSAELLFYWREFSRQVRVHGQVEKLSREASEAYFQTRPRGSQLSALASKQSQPISSREELEAQLEPWQDADALPTPEQWGGYRLRPQRWEFWQGRDNRLHDRLVYEPAGQHWLITRLQP